MGRLRTVFFGTPDFAVPTLRRLAADRRFGVALVVTQPDRPAGRGRRLEASAVKRAAVDLGLPVYQPATLRDPASRAPLVAAGADLFAVAAYGLIFGPKTLAIPRLGCVNVHASLLPAYRGASPIPAAILAGDAVTGVSLMVMEAGLDTGPVLAVAEEPVRPDDTTASLTPRLADLGAGLAVEAVPQYAAGELPPVPQPAQGSLTRPLVKADGRLDWSRPAEELARRVRAMWPWPRAWTTLGGQVLQVHAASPLGADEARAGALRPGGAVRTAEGVAVSTGRGLLRLETVQLPGGRPVPGTTLFEGRHLRPGDVLGADGAPQDAAPVVVPA